MVLSNRKVFGVAKWWLIVLGASLFFSSAMTMNASAAPLYCADFNQTLERGDTDSGTDQAVSHLQAFLAQHYNVSTSELVTGFFGNVTKTYVARFQLEQGLPVVGVVGPRTSAAMKAQCSKVAVMSDVSQYSLTASTTVASTTLPVVTATVVPVIVPPGGTAQIQWTATHARTCILRFGPSNEEREVVGLTGTRTFDPARDGTRYLVRCFSADNSTSTSVVLHVKIASLPPTVPNPPATSTAPTATTTTPVTPPKPPATSTIPTTPKVETRCGEMLVGSELQLGKEIWSCNKEYRLAFQTDGNLVLYKKIGTGQAVVWDARTKSLGASKFVVEGDRLTLRDHKGNIVWSSRDRGAVTGTAALLRLTDKGILEHINKAGDPLWFNGCGFLPKGASLAKGTRIYSCDKKVRLDHQSDGNVVVYKDGTALWSTKTAGRSTSRLAMQGDGNLVLYDTSEKPLWTPFSKSGVVRNPEALGIFVLPAGLIQVRDSKQSLWASGEIIDDSTTKRDPAATVSTLNQTDPMTWLVKSVCVTASEKIVVADPYGGCPVGTTMRKLNVSEPLPYSNVDQGGKQQKDSFPMRNPKTGEVLVASIFDYEKFGSFNLYDASDGHDVYGIKDGWATAFSTQDGGGYSTTFFGEGCKVGGGWVLFPERDFRIAGSDFVPISGVYWEQSGESFPGTCPPGYAYDSRTDWEMKSVTYGGVKGNPTKTMDSIVSTHGFQSSDYFLRYGHLEVFYFTREYGVTKWEVWRPKTQNPVATSACANTGSRSYQGVEFVVTDCRDWSNVRLAETASVPVFPIPNWNVLKSPHFDDDFLTHWDRGGVSREGNIINWTLNNSNADLDRKYASRGVRYLATNCGGTCGPENSQLIYHDIPAGEFVSGETYGYGANLRLANGHVGTGKFRVAIQQLDGSGRVLWARAKDVEVTTNNGNSTRSDVLASVYRTSKFVGAVEKIDLYPETKTIRYVLAPLTSHTFIILNSWLAPWPKAEPILEVRKR